RRISEITSRSFPEVLSDLDIKKLILEQLVINKIRSYKDIAKYVYKYYVNPKEALNALGVVMK
ncbi:MAG: hypothetical protein QW339_05470, partial [Sulfolobales archaeon]